MGYHAAAVLASNLIFALTMNLPLFANEDTPRLLNVINATASITTRQTSTGTVYEATRMRDGLYQDPFTCEMEIVDAVTQCSLANPKRMIHF